MYSMVLMMAMASSPEAAAFGGHGCHGSCHGYSACYGSCTGYTSCYGSCTGGHAHHSHHSHGCSGCYGSCTGYTPVSYGCTGYSSCYGSCSGYSSCYGSCHGCHGGGLFSRHKSHGCHGSSYGCTGCTGCYGGVYYGCTGGCWGGTPVTPVKPEVSTGTKTAMTAQSAVIVVKLPADAKLMVDGRATTSTTGERRFTTPELAVGQDYFYTLSAEVVRDGKTVMTTEKVVVRAGETSTVTIEPATAVVLK